MITHMKTYTSISLFSGMGGDTLGMTLAGCNVIGYNELNPSFCKTHDLNFNCELISDGKTTDISKLKDECFLKFKNKADILFAGFPCQGFSTAGKKDENDPRNTLFLEFLRATRLIEPYMIIGENVKGLISRKTSTGDLYINVIVKEFEKLGYTVIYKVFRTENYNVPQSRERLIILGIKNNNPYGWIPKFPLPCASTKNLQPIVKYSMQGAVRVNKELFNDIPQECIITDLTDTNLYKDNNNGHPYLISKLNASEQDRLYAGKQHNNLFSFGKRISPIHCEIVDIRQPSKTIICTYNHQPRLFVPVRNTSGYYLRMFTTDELKQIQGFPIDYKINGSTKDAIVQIGNAVPPPLIKAIVEQYVH